MNAARPSAGTKIPSRQDAKSAKKAKPDLCLPDCELRTDHCQLAFSPTTSLPPRRHGGHGEIGGQKDGRQRTARRRWWAAAPWPLSCRLPTTDNRFVTDNCPPGTTCGVPPLSSLSPITFKIALSASFCLLLLPISARTLVTFLLLPSGETDQSPEGFLRWQERRWVHAKAVF